MLGGLTKNQIFKTFFQQSQALPLKKVQNPLFHLIGAASNYIHQISKYFQKGLDRQNGLYYNNS